MGSTQSFNARFSFGFFFVVAAVCIDGEERLEFKVSRISAKVLAEVPFVCLEMREVVFFL